MSIYVVWLCRWFPLRSSKESLNNVEARDLARTAKTICQASKCANCNGPIPWRSAWGYHAIPWGYYTEEIWCSKKCWEKQ